MHKVDLLPETASSYKRGAGKYRHREMTMKMVEEGDRWNVKDYEEEGQNEVKGRGECPWMMMTKDR